MRVRRGDRRRRPAGDIATAGPTTSVPFNREVAVLRPDEAVPVVALYLRRQRRFVAHRDANGQGGLYLDSGLLWWICARDLLPNAWRWHAAALQHDVSAGTERISLLTHSGIERVARALRARDRLHAALLAPQDNNTADDVLDELDTVVIQLLGALDAAARVAHIALGIAKSPLHRTGWQSTEFRNAVRPAAPKLATSSTTAPPAAASSRFFGCYGNSVHGQMLTSVAARRTGDRRVDTVVRLPQEDRDALLDAADLAGDRDTWGFHDLGGRNVAHCALLVERLVPESINLLDSLIAETPVALLPGVSLSPADDLPPTDDDELWGVNTHSS